MRRDIQANEPDLYEGCPLGEQLCANTIGLNLRKQRKRGCSVDGTGIPWQTMIWDRIDPERNLRQSFSRFAPVPIFRFNLGQRKLNGLNDQSANSRL